MTQVGPSRAALAPYVSQAVGMAPRDLDRAFRPARVGDLSAVLALRRAVLTNVWWNDESYMRWRYFDRATADAGRLPYWVFERDGEIIGACGLEPVTLAVDGLARDAVRTMDIMVAPSLNGSGLGAFMNVALFSRYPIVLASGTNEQSHHLVRRLFVHVGDLTSWKSLIASRAFVESRLQSAALTEIVANGTDLLLTLDRLRRRTFSPQGIVIEPLQAFDGRADALCRACERPGRVMVRRHAAHLNWRFVQNPRCRYRAFGAFDGERLVGYVVVRLNLERANPRREGEIVDWLAAPDLGADRALLPALIQAGLQALVDDGAELVTCAAFDTSIQAAMNGNLFRARSAVGSSFYIHASEASVSARLSRPDGWFLTKGDFDVE